MTRIYLSTKIKASRDIVFDISRNIDLHIESSGRTKEKAIDGKTTGLIGLNEFVTWEAKHFGFKQNLTVKITEFNRPSTFTDEMIKGTFKSMKHVHTFTEYDEGTVMKDEFYFEAPFGILGEIVEKLILKPYMTKFLIERNRILREYAEKTTIKNK